jgi:dihydroneopterin aldolase
MDIKLRGIKFPCHIGVPDQERSRPQTIEVDLDLLDVDSRGGNYLDYYKVWETMVRAGKDRPFVLVEELAEQLATTLLSDFRGLGQVRLVVRKTPAEMPGITVEVELLKSR